MRSRRILLTCAVALAVLGAGAGVTLVAAQAHQPVPAAGRQPAPDPHAQPGPAAKDDVREGAAGERHTAEEEHAEGLLPMVARLANFAILVGILVYFLRSPLAMYLASRSEQIRADLVSAADLRRRAESQLAEVEQQLAALPAELEALRRRGTEDIAAEEARIHAVAEADRERLLEHMRRDVEMQVRVARRALMSEAAALATEVARQRIQKTITPDDQMRLIDRYTKQLGAVR